MTASERQNLQSLIVNPKEIQPQQPEPSDIQFTEARQRLPINIFSNGIWLVLNVIVTMWYTPYLIGHLGVAVYGLVPLVSSITAYMTIVTTGLDSAIGRFLTIDLAKNNVNGARRTFNTAIVASLIVVAILFPLILIISWFAPQMFNMPPGHERDMQWLVLLTTAGFLINTFASTFAVSSYAYHRFDLRLLVNVLRLMTQMGSIILLFTVLTPKLWHIGVGVFLSMLVFLLGHRVLWRRLTPELSVKLNQFDPSQLKEFFGFSGWVLVNSIGAILFLNIDLIVANLVFGPDVAGRYGSVMIFPSSLRTLVATVNGVLVPILLTLYARNNRAKLVRFSQMSVKLMGVALALPIGLLCGLARPLLTVWLGPEFADLSWLVVALVGHLCINAAVIPIASLQIVTNNVRTPGIMTLAMGMANVGLAAALALWSGWGYISIAIAGAIVLTAKNAIFTPLYNARILKLPWFTFLPGLIAGAVGCLTVGLGAYWVSLSVALTSWGQLIFVMMAVSMVYAIAVYFLGLDASDRHLLKMEFQHRQRSRVYRDTDYK